MSRHIVFSIQIVIGGWNASNEFVAQELGLVEYAGKM